MVKTELFIKEYSTSGSYPSLFECSDGKRYVVKHSQQNRNYLHLINEFIAYSLAKIAFIPTPDFSLIEIIPGTIPNDYNFERGKPIGIGFGSRFLSGMVSSISSIDFIILLIKSQKSKKTVTKLIEDLIKICAFDICLRNEDRSHNNPNLLVNETNKKIGLFAIDHSCIFGGLDYIHLSQEEIEIPPMGATLVDKELFLECKERIGISLQFFIDESCEMIARISDNKVEKIVDSVPEAWMLEEAEKIKIVNFIKKRKNLLLNHFNELVYQLGV